MEQSIKQLVDLANGLLKGADVGKEYTMEYVVGRMETALDEYPSDPIIRSVAQIIHKQASKGKLIISQREMYEIYNHYAGLTLVSQVKEAIGDLLYKTAETSSSTIGNETAYTYRANTPELDMTVQYNPLQNIFDKTAVTASYYDPTLAKLAKHALEQELMNIGVPSSDVKVFGGNDHAIVYDAIFKNKLGTTHIAIPVEIHDGVETPSVFFNKNQFIELTAENLNKYIVDNASPEDVSINVASKGIRTSSSVFSPSFAFEEDAPKEIMIDRIPMPAALKDFAAFEEALIDSSTSFSPELVRTAKAICSRELINMGLKAQVSLAEASDNCIICRAELDSAAGKVEIKLPIEIINQRPQLPSLFYSESNKEKIYDFSKIELVNYLTAARPENGQILRYSNDFFNMTYNQLKDEMLAGAATKNYLRAEQALNRIEDVFGADQHRAALADYAKYLVHASIVDEKPQHKCKLLITKGSIEPRCGHYNVPISRVATDERGNCELIERKAKYKNLAESTGAIIRSNKITLT